MPVLECSITPPDEDDQTSKNDYPAIKYLILAILFFIVSKFTSLRSREKTGKGIHASPDINETRSSHGDNPRDQPRI